MIFDSLHVLLFYMRYIISHLFQILNQAGLNAEEIVDISVDVKQILNENASKCLEVHFAIGYRSVVPNAKHEKNLNDE